MSWPKLDDLPKKRSKPPLRCTTYGCGHWARVPKNWNDAKIVEFPKCGPCKRREELRSRRAANLMRNIRRSEGDR